MKLSVVVITYNQRRYVEQCLDSILLQKTDFDWEVVIGDDASKDGTQEVLKRYAEQYPERIKLLLHEENRGLEGNYKSVFEAASGEYIAICEGDDYWTDENKLQQQVDFLDKHEDYGFVGSKDKLYDGDKGVFKDDLYFIDQKQAEDRDGNVEMFGDVFEKYAIYGPVTRTVTVMFRRRLIEDCIEDVSVGDYVLQAILSSRSKFGRIDGETSVYRISSGISAKNRDSYNRFFIRNMERLSELFPKECGWLKDKVAYLRLKIAVEKGNCKEAIAQKRLIEGDAYRNKSYYKCLKGPLSFAMLHVALKIQQHGR